MIKDIRVATVIFNSLAGQTDHNLNKMVLWTSMAKKEGADIVCFPEMNVTGYVLDNEIKTTAETVPGPATEKLLHISATHDIVILAGMAEKDAKGRIFATHLVVKPDGISNAYRKLHIAPPERSVLSPGGRVLLFHTHGVKFGIQLCYDAHFPELSTFMALKGAELLFIPHASPRGTPEEKYASWTRHLPARAYDNSIFVVACNQTGDNGKGFSFPGIAVMFDPSGNEIRKNISGQEGIMIADLKAKDLTKVRNHQMRFFLPNRRPELLKNIPDTISRNEAKGDE